MKDLKLKYSHWRETHPESSYKEHIDFLNQELLDLYPDLMIRWSKIYGYRWAHICGNTCKIGLNPLKLTLNRDYGICIDNPDIFIPDELERIILSLKECFAHDSIF